MKRRIAIYSLFPEAVEAVLGSSILRRAQLKGLVELAAKNIRDFATDKHQRADDSPYGGKQGMLLMPHVLGAAMEHELALVSGQRKNMRVILSSPRGLRLEQEAVERLAGWIGAADPADAVEATSGVHSPCQGDTPGRSLVFVCGRYEGVDERFVDEWVDLELSLGDFILSGGEIAALAAVDAIVRILPGALGNAQSSREDSFSNGLLEYPQFTRPRKWAGRAVPELLAAGDHAKTEAWQLRQSLLLTAAFRPDLIERHSGEALPDWAKDLLEILKKRCREES